MSEAFRFKQFEIAQNQCTIKVNTDGVLLGSWAEVNDSNTILDIGTGTGVLAMMMAQKCNSAAVDAIDIDENAYRQAKENFGRSAWKKRLTAIHTSLQNFSTAVKYHTVISNPPYFVNDFKSASEQKNIARHSIELNYGELLSGINRLLGENGKAFLVIPAFNFQLLQTAAEKENLFVTKLTEVIAVTGKAPYLVLMQLEREKKQFLRSRIAIQNTDGSFTDEYKTLTKDFYLKF